MSVEAICGIALCCCAASMVLKGIKAEYALCVGAAGGVILLFYALGAVRPIAEFINEITADSPYSSYYLILLKATGVAFLTHSAAEICRDCGEGSVGNKVEMIGKLSIIILSLPVIKKLIEMAKELMT